MLMKNYYVYVLACADGTLYCGYTDDVTKRLQTHNSGNGAKYTKARLPVKLLTAVKFDDKSTAMKCEWWFKHKLLKAKKLELVKSDKLMKSAFEAYQNKKNKIS